MDVVAQARDWLSQDPDPVTRAELQGLLDAGEIAALEDRFATRLQFGTAGLRGALGAGPARMNRVIVARASAGLAAHLLDRADGPPSIVIGHDARHNSAVFARDTAEIMAGAGVHTMLLPTHLPTPVLAFAIRHLSCSAGVMVTASHNPAQDNGYKVYLADSSQIVPPIDADISAAIDAVGRIDRLPRSTAYAVLGPEVALAYVEAVAALVGDGPRDITAAYTPLHGVGRDIVAEAVSRSGFPPLHVVAEQAEPDPDFPTVDFPNPEEPGAMDLAIALGVSRGTDLVLANDPDADRCAVGVRRGTSHQMLTGDQVGVLIGDLLLRKGVQGTYAASIVSSGLLGRLAVAAGQEWQQTLTGFKWLGKIPTLAFGYEEALGYGVAPHIARDKDGISAIVMVLELAAALKAEGRTLFDRLDEIHREHGVHATSQLSVRTPDPAVISRAMDALRHSPPGELGGLVVGTIDDLADGFGGLPPTEGVRLGLVGAPPVESARVICRPSGTEPKLKCYLEVVVPVSGSLDEARSAATGTLEAIRAGLSAALDL